MTQLRNAILNAVPTLTKVEAWGQTLYLRPWSAKTRVMIGEEKAEPMRFIGLILVHSLCDESGTLLFSVDDIDALMDKDSDTVQTLGKAVLDLNKVVSTDDTKKN